MATLISKPWSGLVAGPAAWAISTQLNYGLVEWQCRHGIPVIPIAALVLALMAAAGGWLSWIAFSRSNEIETAHIRMDHFIAGLGVLAAALFSLVTITQGAAALVLDECIR
jgi:hypothetical protein